MPSSDFFKIGQNFSEKNHEETRIFLKGFNMKKTVFAVLFFVLINVPNSALAAEPGGSEVKDSGPKLYSCIDLYHREALRKSKVNAVVGKTLESAGFIATASSIAGGPAGLPVFAAGFISMGIGMLIESGDSREDKALNLVDEYGRQWNNLAKRARKRISGLSDADLVELVQKGFYSGLYCSREKLFSWREIETDVLKTLDKAAQGRTAE